MNNPYLRLMRFDKPIGTFLLWYPTAWALWASNHGAPDFKILVLFFLGTLVMRSVGCVINDISDRNLDKFVSRTRMRPLATQEISLKSALVLAFILLVIACIILINLPATCFKYALIAVLLTCIYPLTKRFIHTPQFMLSLAFSMGIPMAYAASDAFISSNAILLFTINMLWIITYDTFYAMADKKDDLVIGIKSTAIYFGNYDKQIVAFLQAIMHILWLVWAKNEALGFGFYPCWGLAILILFWQHEIIKVADPKSCIDAFLTNNYYGAFLWAGMILGFF